MKIINVKAEHNYQVEIGIEFSSVIKQICNSHRKVLLLAPAPLIKLFKVKDSKNLFLLPTPNGESQKSTQFCREYHSNTYGLTMAQFIFTIFLNCMS